MASNASSRSFSFLFSNTDASDTLCLNYITSGGGGVYNQGYTIINSGPNGVNFFKTEGKTPSDTPYLNNNSFILGEIWASLFIFLLILGISGPNGDKQSKCIFTFQLFFTTEGHTPPQTITCRYSEGSLFRRFVIPNIH